MRQSTSQKDESGELWGAGPDRLALFPCLKDDCVAGTEECGHRTQRLSAGCLIPTWGRSCGQYGKRCTLEMYNVYLWKDICTFW